MEIMAIPYSLAMRNTSPAHPESGSKTYVLAQYARVMDLEDMAEHMSAHDSKYNKGDIMAVMMQMATCVREQLLLGNKVVLGGLGSFAVRLHSEGVDNVEDFCPGLIRTVTVRWRPSAQMCTMKQDARFRFVGTRRSQNEARKAERQRLGAVAQEDTGESVTAE